jgi:prepilin-type processing-associated H-X9-DG protein/prepilin-type N-terminal cleavage/methylation domain-containing protein
MHRHGLASPRAVRPRAVRPSAGFTLVELLVVIGIIAVLMSILLPTLGRVRDQAKTIKCGSNLRQIGTAANTYAGTYNGQLAPWTNLNRWSDPTNPNEVVDPYHRDANNEVDVYWGVRYALAGTLPRVIFNCPTETRTNDAGRDNDATYTHYGLNGYGIGLTNDERDQKFGSRTEFSLFTSFRSQWIGRRISRIRNPTQTIFCLDSGEVTIDGNHDTFDDWQQHAVSLQPEWLRHNKRANVLFCDGHVGQLSREEQADTRWYTGRW